MKLLKKIFPMSFVLVLTVVLSGFVFADGYIVNIKNPFYDNGQAMMLMAEEITNENMVEYLSENVDNTTSLVADKGIITADEEALSQLLELGVVASYEPDIKLYLLSYDYNQNPDFENQWAFDAIKADYSWNAGVFGKGVKVGVLDTGVYPHEDLTYCLEEGHNYVNDTTDTTDSYGHGTFVSGIIAAQCNDKAIVGLAHGVSIVPLKVSNGRDVDLSKVVPAIYDAVDVYGCDVINMSFGTTSVSESLKQAVDYAVTKGTIVVAAAGNGAEIVTTDDFGNETRRTDYTVYLYPASFDNAVSVSNVKKNLDSYVVSSTSTHNDKVNVASPGTNLYSLDNSYYGISSGSGTSYAAPYVTATAALLKSIDKSLTHADFLWVLRKSVDKSYITTSQGSDYWGLGMLDVKAAVKYLLKSYYKGYYMSPIDVNPFTGKSSMYITNLGTSYNPLGTMILFNKTGDGVIDKVETVDVSLDIDGSVEVPFAKFGGGERVNYMFLSPNFSPILPLTTVTID